ncbi:C3 and PZP-like alpha-2-macroglobulin domain-containing protein 8 [Protopterus annectens]|uniref:C3 and PZP-like alpha-2-macroglobulin domain-containing protein 8 n=1 Tax=Protopterus annectens TaxID=7888 RepID=UPI001CFBCD96|nr:C3 and PZP-like alpha-2-macroglobulin domain-containing protein 8 [Protopterus annectens]
MQSMFSTLWIFLNSLLLLYWSCSAQPKPGYLIAAPSVFRSGEEEAISVTIFNAAKETKVQVQLVIKGETVAHSHGTVFDKGTIKLKLVAYLMGDFETIRGISEEVLKKRVWLIIFRGLYYMNESSYERML